MISSVTVGIVVFAGLVLALPVCTVTIQILSSLLWRPQTRPLDAVRPTLVILIPAHNEQDVIERTLTSLSHQLENGDRIVVVADHCTDHTAKVAQRAGAEVTIRANSPLRGKGYALDHGLQYIKKTGIPKLVIFIDADCEVTKGCIDWLARLSHQVQRPVQAAYHMALPSPPQKSSSTVAFAWKISNYVRPLGSHYWGLPCQLCGSGMAFPWEVALSINLASSYLIEDVKQGLDLALRGNFPLFCPEVSVVSEVIANGSQTNAQRTRWEHGAIETMWRYVPILLLRYIQNRDIKLLAMALDIAVPPLSLLALLLVTYLTIAGVSFFVTGVIAPLAIAAIACALSIISIGVAWWSYGQNIIPFRWLAFAPIYAVRKVPLYIKFILKPQREWVKGR
jgi:cellulose synthase/poly-beta-1,6-N-acetylglucosamine synthase-like glycosyltransferase